MMDFELDDLITPEYRELNEQLHADRNDYGVKGNRRLMPVKQVRKDYECDTVLDYGCGSAALSRYAKFDIANFDPCIPEHSDMPEPADLVVCNDVLEHVEPEKLDGVLTHLQYLIQKAGYFVIATRYDKSKLLADGSNPHKIVENAHWWKKKLKEYFKIDTFNVKKGEIECVVR